MLPKSILTISRDELLQQTRTLMLEQSGFHVSPARSDQEAIAFLTASNTFELILLCHSVPETSRVLLVTLAKKLFPALPILILYNGYEHTEAQVDGAIHNLDSPASVISMVKFLTGHAGQH